MAPRNQAFIGEKFRGMDKESEQRYVGWLNDLHWEQGKTREELAKIAGTTIGAISVLFERNGCKMRRGYQAHRSQLGPVRLDGPDIELLDQCAEKREAS